MSRPRPLRPCRWPVAVAAAGALVVVGTSPATAVPLATAVSPAMPAPAHPAAVRAGVTTTFDRVGGPWSYTVPAGVRVLRVTALGGGGGGGRDARGGNGARVVALVHVEPGEVLRVDVAGGGRGGRSGGGGGSSVVRGFGVLVVAGGGGGGGEAGPGGDGGRRSGAGSSGDVGRRATCAARSAGAGGGGDRSEGGPGASAAGGCGPVRARAGASWMAGGAGGRSGAATATEAADGGHPGSVGGSAGRNGGGGGAGYGGGGGGAGRAGGGGGAGGSYGPDGLDGLPPTRYDAAGGRGGAAARDGADGTVTIETTARRPTPDHPVIDRVLPDAGPTSGGTELVIRGRGLHRVTEVRVGGRAATGLVVEGAGRISVLAPAHRAGRVEVVVVTAIGRAVARNAYRYR